MSNKRNIKNTKKVLEIIIGIIFIIVSIINWNEYSNENVQANGKINSITYEEIQNVELTEKNKIQIHFFDVGQADSILLISNNKTMLIDAGTNSAGKTVVQNIKKLGIKKIDYLIGTHPHEDHIGGLDDVIKSFDIGTIYMPKIQTNTKTYEDVLDAIFNKGLKVTSPQMGDIFNVGDIKCEVMLCDTELAKQEDNLNLSSIVIRAVYDKQSYLFMGDSEKENEQSRNWPQTNVLKVGHHGSDTSSSQNFLNQVLPQIAIIQVGEDNSYSHPHKTVLNRLNKLGTVIYKTNEQKNILIESDGINNKVSFYK